MLKIPYGNTYIEFNEGSANVLTSSIDKLRSSGSGSDIVRRAMLRPIDSPRACTRKEKLRYHHFRPHSPCAEPGYHPQHAA